MILTCPACAARYLLDPVQLGAGRRVQCARCRHVWRQLPPDLPSLSVPRPVAGVAVDEAGKAAPETSQPLTQAPSGEPPPARYPVPSTELRRQGGGAAGWAILLLAILAVVGVVAAGRNDIIRVYPPALALYEAVGLPVDRAAAAAHPRVAAGLTFHDFAIAARGDGADATLILTGRIVNESEIARPVPALAVHMVGADGQVLGMAALDTVDALAPGEARQLEASLPEWPAGAISARVVAAEG